MAKPEDRAARWGYRRQPLLGCAQGQHLRPKAFVVALLAAILCSSAISGSPIASVVAAAAISSTSAVSPKEPPLIPQPHARTPLPSEGWTSFSHWTRASSGKVSLQLYPAAEFRSQNGRWNTIDTSVRPHADPAFPYSAEGAIRPVRFGNKSSAILEMSLDSGTVSLSAPSLTIGQPHPNARGVTYESVARDTDLSYAVANGAIQEQLILHSGSAPAKFTFHVSDPNHILGGLRREPDGGYATSGRIDNNVAIGFAAPTAYEQPQDPRSLIAAAPSSAHLVITPGGDGFDETVSVDQRWLGGKSYPMVLDPSVIFSDSTGALLAGFISYSQSYCGGPCLLNTNSDLSANDNQNSGSTDNEPGRSVYRFDLSSIPSGSQVSSAAFAQHVVGCAGAVYYCNQNNYTVELHPLTGYWDPTTATFSSLDSLMSSSVLDSVYQTAFSCNPDDGTPPCGHAMSWNNLAGAVQGWVNNPSTNYGFIAKLQTETLNEGGLYWSYLGPYSGDAHPYLQVSFTPPALAGSDTYGGGSPASDYKPCSSPNPVDCNSGNFWHTIDDISVPGRGMPLDFTQTYNSSMAQVNGPPTAVQPYGQLGFGWTDSYDMNLQVDALGNYVVHQENGSTASFTPLGGGQFVGNNVLGTLVERPGSNYIFTRRAREQFTFDEFGQLTRETDLNGNTTTLTYQTFNNGDQLATVTDSSQRTLSFSYFSSGLLQSVTDSAGRSVSFGYNDLYGDLTDVYDVNGGHTQFTYYPNTHLLYTMTDARQDGSVTNYYDGSNRVYKQTDKLQRATLFDYTSIPGATTITDPAGNVTVEYYSNNMLSSLTKGYGTTDAATWKYQYDPATLGTSQIEDPNLHFTYQTFDPNGNLATVTDPLNRTTVQVWDSLNDLRTRTDGNNVTTTYTYDSNGNLTSASTPLLSSSGTIATQQVTSYCYYNDATCGAPAGGAGDLYAMTDPDGNAWTYTYDASGDRVTTADPLGNTSTTCYNAIGWTLASYSPKAGPITCGNAPPASPYKTTYDYVQANGMTDEFGDVQSITDPLTHVTSWTYDADRNQASETDGDRNQTKYKYDAANEETDTKRADGTTLHTDYFGDGTVQDQKDGAGHTILAYLYDHLARVKTVTDALSHVTSYTYDGASNELTKQDPGGNCAASPPTKCTTMTYDAANEPFSTSYSDSSAENVSSTGYDGDGQRTGMTDGSGSSTWTYDSLHRLTSYTNGAGAIVSYGYVTASGTYDLKDQIDQMVYPNSAGTLQRAFDAVGRLTSVTDWYGKSTTFGYDANSNLKTTSLPGSASDARGFNDADQVTSITSTVGSATPFSATYGRDGNGQVSSDTSDAAAIGSYAYTSLNQVCYAGSSSTANCVSPAPSYVYDHADNATTLSVGTSGSFAAQTQAFNKADQLCWTLVGTSTNACGSAPSGATTFTYDSRGNRTQVTPGNAGPSACYTYDRANRITGVVSGSGTACATNQTAVAGYVYDGTGLRMAKTVSGATTQFAWDEAGGTPLLVQQATGTVSTNFVYGPGGSPIEQLGTTAPAPQGAAQRSVWATSSSSNYQLSGNNGSTWVAMDGSRLSLLVTPSVTSTAMLTASADLFTSAANVNQDVGISVNGATPLVWKEGGGRSAYAPASVAAQTPYTMQKGMTYNVVLEWKTNVTQPSGSSIQAGAGAGPAFSPTTLTAVLTPSAKNLVASASSTGAIQFTTSSTSWVVMDNSVTTTFTAPNNGNALLSASADVFASTVGTAQDVGICVAQASHLTAGCGNGTVVAWEENGGAASYMPIAARVDASSAVSSGTQYTVGIVWRASASNQILAGAGPSAPFSPSSVIVQMSPTSDNDVSSASTTSQVSRTASSSDDGTAWADLGAPASISLTPEHDGIAELGGNASLFSSIGTVNIDLGICVAIGSGPCTTVGWTESGSLSAFAPDAASLQVPYLLTAEASYTVKLQWRTNSSMPTGSTIYAGAGTNPYSPTTLTALSMPLTLSALFYHKDQLGSTRVLTDLTGTVQATYQYDPYGNLFQSTGTVTNPIRFAGQYWDQETNLYYLRARYYEPATAQFLSNDPLIALTHSPYGYVGGNPLNSADASGLDHWSGPDTYSGLDPTAPDYCYLLLQEMRRANYELSSRWYENLRWLELGQPFTDWARYEGHIIAFNNARNRLNNLIAEWNSPENPCGNEPAPKAVSDWATRNDPFYEALAAASLQAQQQLRSASDNGAPWWAIAAAAVAIAGQAVVAPETLPLDLAA